MRDAFAGAMVPGAPAADAPIARGSGAWLLASLHEGFTLALFGDAPLADATQRALASLARDPIACSAVVVGAPRGRKTCRRTSKCIADRDGLLAARYDAQARHRATCFRPDQHVCARWRAFDPAKVRGAAERARAQSAADAGKPATKRVAREAA